MVDFALAGPVWLIRRGDGKNVGLDELASQLIVGRSKDGSGLNVLPVFTDDDLATRFLERMNDPTLSAIQLGEPEQLISFLNLMPLVDGVAADMGDANAVYFTKQQFANVLRANL